MGTVPHEDISITHKGDNKNLVAALTFSTPLLLASGHNVEVHSSVFLVRMERIITPGVALGMETILVMVTWQK